MYSVRTKHESFPGDEAQIILSSRIAADRILVMLVLHPVVSCMSTDTSLSPVVAKNTTYIWRLFSDRYDELYFIKEENNIGIIFNILYSLARLLIYRIVNLYRRDGSWIDMR